MQFGQVLRWIDGIGGGKMRYYPLFLDIKDRPVLVIGGGFIALEKIINLRRAGANLTVIAPEIHPSIHRYRWRIQWIQRTFCPIDIQSRYVIVFGATGDSVVNRRIAGICQQRRILYNSVDDPVNCEFIVPAIVRRGEVTIAISTGGTSPTLAKLLKTTLQMVVGVEYTILTRILRQIRGNVFQRFPAQSDRFAFWKRLFCQNPLKLIHDGHRSVLETWIRREMDD